MTVGKRVAVVSSKLLLVLLSCVLASKSAFLGLKKTFLCKSNKCVDGFVLVKMHFRVCGEI